MCGEEPRYKDNGKKKVKDKPELTDKEHRFCVEYSVCDNATKSYQRAFQGTYNTARTEGSRLLAKPCIRQRIDELRADRNKRLAIDADDIIRKFKILSDYDAADFFDDDGRIKPLSELDPDLRFAIQGLDVSESITGEDGDGISRLMKIKLPNKNDALTALAKHLMLFESKPKEDNGDLAEAARIFAQAMASTQTPANNNKPSQ